MHTKTFAVHQKGIKNLGTYPRDKPIEYLKSYEEVLLNCQNIIPLQPPENISYESLCGIIHEHTLTSYLFQNQTNQELLLEIEDRELKKVDLSEMDESLRTLRKGHNFFRDWAIYRHEACTE